MKHVGAPAFLIRLLTTISIGGLSVAVGHRLWLRLMAVPFVDPRIAGLSIPAVESRRARVEENRGGEVVVVLIGMAGCAASRQPALAAAMDQIRARLRVLSSERGIPIAFWGVALDRDLSKGLRWLTSVGPFDEISVGGNWLNSQAVRFMFGGSSGPATVPQIIVFQRTIDQPSSSTLVVGPETIATRRVGVQPILDWVVSDDPIVGLPRLTPRQRVSGAQ